MRYIFGKVNWQNWDIKQKLVSSQTEDCISIFNDFINISICSSFNHDLQNYYYDSQNNILLLFFGVQLIDQEKQNKSSSMIQELIYFYLKNKGNYLKSVRGTFITALIDLNKHKVILSSDSIGQLKLYYKSTNSILEFSSRINDLVDENIKINKFGLIQYLLIDHYLDKNTIFENIYRVENGTSITIENGKILSNQYFDIFNFLLENKSQYKKDTKEEIKEIGQALVKAINNYSSFGKISITLTGGFDSRLLLAGILENKQEIDAFTFGVKNNLEIEIAKKIVNKTKQINFTEIILDENYQNYISNYFNYIKESKNIELNLHRYHYIYLWGEKLRNIFFNSFILTGICGDAFVRDGISTTPKSEKFVYKLSLTDNVEQEIVKHVNNKKELLYIFNLNVTEVVEYLFELFKTLKDNDPYFNHFFVKIIVRVLNSFGSELTTENNYLPTFTPFLDLDYLKLLSESRWSIFSNPFIVNKYSYRIKSQKYYAELINLLYKDLLKITTNRGFPLKFALSKKYLVSSVLTQYQYKRKYKTRDLNYSLWDKTIKIPNVNKLFNFDENIKIEILNNWV